MFGKEKLSQILQELQTIEKSLHQVYQSRHSEFLKVQKSLKQLLANIAQRDQATGPIHESCQKLQELVLKELQIMGSKDQNLNQNITLIPAIETLASQLQIALHSFTIPDAVSENTFSELIAIAKAENLPPKEIARLLFTLCEKYIEQHDDIKNVQAAVSLYDFFGKISREFEKEFDLKILYALPKDSFNIYTMHSLNPENGRFVVQRTRMCGIVQKVRFRDDIVLHRLKCLSSN